MKDLLLLLCRYPYDPATSGRLKELLRQVDDWEKTVRLINEHGIIALAAYNIKESGLSGLVPEQPMAILENGLRQSIVRNTWLTERWKEVNKILTGAGIKHVLLKGMALEHTIYGAKGLRQMNDNDIFVKREDAIKAWNILQTKGFKPELLKSPLHRKIIFDSGKHLPALYKNGYAVEIHHKLFDTSLSEGMNLPDPVDDAVPIFIGDTEAFILPHEIQLKHLTDHFRRHALEGDQQLRLYADIILLDKTCGIDIPHQFILEPQQHNKPEYRRAAYRIGISHVPKKDKLKYIAGDIFPSLKWMKERYQCNGFSAIFHYPFRIGKLLWLFEKGKAYLSYGRGLSSAKVEEEIENKISIDKTDAIENIKAVLESGNSVELTASGYSMFPTLKNGDRVIVRPLNRGEVPESGSIIVFQDNTGLVIHRVIEKQVIEPGNYVFTTRGDSRRMNDTPVEITRVLGIAVRFRRGTKEYKIKNYVLDRFYYEFNYLELWLHLSLRRAAKKIRRETQSKEQIAGR
jgi:signal peptidase I